MSSRQPAQVPEFVTCPEHGKRLYPSRKIARKAAALTRNRNGSRTTLREYRCEHRDGWHIGHLPHLVRRGVISDVEFYRRTRGQEAS